MIVPVLQYGSNILRKHALDISKEENIPQLSEVLADTLKNSGGVGLAAPQTGILLKSFIIDTSPIEKESIKFREQLFINPEITWQSSTYNVFNEACLSIPGIQEEVKRPEKIYVKYFNKEFNLIEEELCGIHARIFQHEFDHLQGILFIDRLKPLKRKLLTGKLNAIKKVN